MFVERDPNGKIVRAWTEPCFPTQEQVADSDIALQRYLLRSPLSQKLWNVGISTDDVHRLSSRVGKYVDRDGDEAVTAVYDVPQRDDHEFLPPDAAALLEFGIRAKAPPEGHSFGYIDGQGWRVLRIADHHAVAQKLPTRQACVDWMAGEYSRQRHLAAKRALEPK